jgi:large subunit ribosomal protein L17
MATSLMIHGQIETTLPKAKDLRRIVEKLVTLARVDSLQNRRLAMEYLMAIDREYKGDAQKLTATHKLFTEIGPRFATRPGGYTRIVRMGIRKGDCAQKAIIAFVEADFTPKNTAPRKRAVKVEAPTAEVEATA